MKYYKSIDYYIDTDDGDIYRYLKAARAAYVKEIYDKDSNAWFYIGIEFDLPEYRWMKKLTKKEAFIEIL